MKKTTIFLFFILIFYFLLNLFLDDAIEEEFIVKL